MKSDLIDRLAIRDLIENWAMWRDAGRWDDFRKLWHADGVMMATWFQGGVGDFIKVSQQGFARGARTSHFQGGMSIDLKGRRAIAQTKMQIAQRGPVEGVVCDVVCAGRSCYCRDNRRVMGAGVRRQPIYERDRMSPVDPAAKLKLDKKLLARFPECHPVLAHRPPRNGHAFTP